MKQVDYGQCDKSSHQKAAAELLANIRTDRLTVDNQERLAKLVGLER